VVTLPEVVVEALAAHLEEYAEPDPDGLVFIAPRGAHLLRSPFHRFVWRPAVKQVGLDGLRVHDLRHTAATLAAAAAATTKELMERMGTPRRRWRCATSTSWPTGRPSPPQPWTTWPGPRPPRRGHAEGT
jgi:hypothetical protein